MTDLVEWIAERPKTLAWLAVGILLASLLLVNTYWYINKVGDEKDNLLIYARILSREQKKTQEEAKEAREAIDELTTRLSDEPTLKNEALQPLRHRLHEVRHHQVVKGHQYAHSRSPQSKPEREQIDRAAQLKRARLILDVHQVGAAGSYRLLDAPPGMNAPVANVGPDMRPRHAWHRPKVAGQDENGEAELLERRCQPGTVIADATGQGRKLASDHQDAWGYVPVRLALLGHRSASRR